MRTETDDSFLESRTFDEINIGDSSSLARTLHQEDIQLFAVMSGDINPAMVDPEYAHSGMFREVIAAGIASGVFREGPVGLLSMGSLGTLNWITLWFNPHRSNTQAQMAQIAEQLARMVVQALRP